MIEINLLPGNLERKKHLYFIKKIKITISVLCICLVIIVCGLYLPFNDYKISCEEKDTVESELNSLIDKSLSNQKNKEELLKYSQYENCTKSIIENRVTLMPMLENIKECMPREVTVEDIVYSNHSVRVTTNTYDYEAIGKYTSGLSRVQGLTRVRVNRVALINSDGLKEYKAYISMNYTKR